MQRCCGRRQLDGLPHDGARRVQDAQYDPVSSMMMMMVGGDSGEQLLASEEMQTQADPVEGAPVDGSGMGISLAASMSGDSSGNFGSEPEDPIGTPVPTYLPRRVEREYIWGPGDGRGGVDELLAQCDAARQLWPVLTDAGGDVVAVVGRSGLGPNAVAVVAGQWTYDAYGSVISADHLFDHPFLSVGHKGLFVERLDVGVADATVPGAQYADTPRLTPFAHHIYHNRNRSYHPTLGRFLQMDPNAAGLIVMSDLPQDGRAFVSASPSMSLDGRLSDGANLYQYVRSSPWDLSDPLGLYSGEDAYEDVTDVMGLLDPIPGPSDFIRSMLKSMVETYSANLEWDSEWAENWGYDDGWSTRESSEWVTVAIAEGLYESFDIDLPFTDNSINPLDMFASSGSMTLPMPGDSGGLRNASGKPTQRHHILTATGADAAQAKLMFGKNYDAVVNASANLVDMPHSGRHSREYHLWVRNQLERAVVKAGLNPRTQSPAVQSIMKDELNKMKKFLQRNPGFLYDTSGRKNTGWRGMRDNYKTGKSRVVRR